MNTDRIWTLLARKLAGEISPEELGELESLLKEHPDTHLKMQALSESWEEPMDRLATEPEEEYQRIIDNLKVQGFMPAAEDAKRHQRLQPAPGAGFAFG